MQVTTSKSINERGLIFPDTSIGFCYIFKKHETKLFEPVDVDLVGKKNVGMRWPICGGGRGTRPSLATVEGLRNRVRNETLICFIKNQR